MKGIKILKTTVIFEKLDEDVDEHTKTASGLYMPSEVMKSVKARTFRSGKVVTCGVDCVHVKAGGTIYYADGTYTTAVLNGEEIFMIQEDSIFATEE